MSFVKDDHSFTRGVGAIAATDQVSSRRRIAADRAARALAVRDGMLARAALGAVPTGRRPPKGRRPPTPRRVSEPTTGPHGRPAPPIPTAPSPTAASAAAAPPPIPGQCSADGAFIWRAATATAGAHWERLRRGEACSGLVAVTAAVRVHAPTAGLCRTDAGKIIVRPAGTECPPGSSPYILQRPTDLTKPPTTAPPTPTPLVVPPSSPPTGGGIVTGGGGGGGAPSGGGGSAAEPPPPPDMPPIEPLPDLPGETAVGPVATQLPKPSTKLLVYAALGIGALWLLTRE